MTGLFLADWALLAISLFNASVLLWLGLTVVLNAERRTVGVWVLGGGMLLGAAFFISHTAILDYELTPTTSSLEFWWRAGWLPVIASPLSWYAMMLWYAGFWSAAPGRLRRRHRPWFIGAIAWSLLLLMLIAFADGLPSFTSLMALDMSGALNIGGLPVVFGLYPPFMILCIVLSIDALRRPAPSERMMGDLARARTRPWLLGAAFVLLAVALLVSWFIAGAVFVSVAGSLRYVYPAVMRRVSWYDLTIEALIGLAILLVGQAIVSYEVFTGKTLPRRGFFRHWRGALLLSMGYAVLVGGSLAWGARPFYSLLLSMLLMVGFMAMFGWQSFVDRERFMVQLRPFVSSDNRLKSILEADRPVMTRASALFEALCRDVLTVKQGQLIALGSTAQLIGEPLVYPAAASAVDVPTGVTFDDRDLMTRVDIGPLRWAVPLLGAQGMMGVLLLSEKHDQLFYAQEEVEIARASAERILDMLAGEEISRRLLALQRRRLAETQVLDHRTRRELHDTVLPDLHTAILELSAGTDGSDAVIASLSALHDRISRLIHIHPAAYFGEDSEQDFLSELKRMIETEFAHQFTAVRWQGEVASPSLDPLAAEVGFYAVREAARNAAAHGRGGNSQRDLNLAVCVEQETDRLRITVQDDGVGWSGEMNSRRRQGGLLLHTTLLAAVGASMGVESEAGAGTRVTVDLPVM